MGGEGGIPGADRDAGSVGTMPPPASSPMFRFFSDGFHHGSLWSQATFLTLSIWEIKTCAFSKTWDGPEQNHTQSWEEPSASCPFRVRSAVWPLWKEENISVIASKWSTCSSFCFHTGHLQL